MSKRETRKRLKRSRAGRSNNPQTQPSQRDAFVIMANRKLARLIVRGAQREGVSESKWLNDTLCMVFDIPEEDR